MSMLDNNIHTIDANIDYVYNYLNYTNDKYYSLLKVMLQMNKTIYTSIYLKNKFNIHIRARNCQIALNSFDSDEMKRLYDSQSCMILTLLRIWRIKIEHCAYVRVVLFNAKIFTL